MNHLTFASAQKIGQNGPIGLEIRTKTRSGTALIVEPERQRCVEACPRHDLHRLADHYPVSPVTQEWTP